MFYSPYGEQGDEPFGLRQDQVSSLFGHNHQVGGCALAVCMAGCARAS